MPRPLLILFFFFCYLLPLPLSAQLTLCVDTHKLNLRSEPSTTSGGIITALPRGTQVEVLLRVDEKWVFVSIGAWRGYLSIQYLGNCGPTLRYTSPKTQSSAQESAVLVCMGKTAYAYHRRYCQGLNRCRSSVVKMSRAEAVSRGRSPCNYCY